MNNTQEISNYLLTIASSGVRYARKRGDIYNLFSVHDDPERLDMAVPLPGVNTISEMHEYLLDLPTDDPLADHATNLIRKWIKEHVE